ncbi:short-chain dehydrogenase [Exophiala viscosa]|uniref:short-chain dehydrogenase n=1 Tax=Exophiala viscosa TaxID=2486360 RepID=UPI002197A274|nr:short-chain dehydrogenase [Exophiala viscosa]
MEFDWSTTGNEVVKAFKNQVTGKTFLITGPTPGGIGAETAISLAAADPKHLILAGRSQAKIQPLINEINKAHAHVKTSFIQLDLASQTSVRQAAKHVKDLLGDDQIDVLILNAAIMACPYALTEDGIESQFGTNHIGHFLFGNLLLKDGLLRSRVVVVSSAASVRKFEVLEPHLKDVTYNHGKCYDPLIAYCLSKACNVLYAKRLSKILNHKNISAFSLHPGSIATNLQGYITEEMRNQGIAAFKEEDPAFVVPKRKDLQQGCATQLRAALDPSLESHSGAYLDDCQVSEPAVHKPAEAHMDEVWELSEKLVGEKFDF